MEEKTLVSEESTPASGFLYREDYLLFGLLVRHGLCQPRDMRALVLVQRGEGKRAPLISILSQSSGMTDKTRKDIEELLRILATPDLRKYLPNELPAVDTLVETLRLFEPAEATRRDPIDDDEPITNMPATMRDTAPNSRAARSSSSTFSFAGTYEGDGAELLTDSEKQRVSLCQHKSELVGRVLGGYIFIDKLGTGGQGDVYLAKQISLNRNVALKRLHVPENAEPEEFLNAFRIEAQTLGQINHSRIVKVYEIFMDDGIAFFSMEYLNGRTLKDMVVQSGGAMRVDVVANLACQACSALSRTAEDNLVHRDIKPANMMVDENGDLKIVDFGLAGLAKSFGSGESFSGTPQYASPEQIKSEKLTPQSDMYSLGMTLYYCVTGQLPLKAPNAKAMMRAQVDDIPKQPSLINTQLPREVDHVIMKMIEKDPAKRYKTFDDCFEAWNKILTQSSNAPMVAGNASLLGEALLQFTKKERSDILRRSVYLGLAWLCLAVGAVLTEGVLRRHNLDYIIAFCGNYGSLLLAFSLSCIFYVAMARRHWLPILGSLRVWLYVHIATAIPAVAMILLHCGRWLGGVAPGPPDAKPLLSILISTVLLVTAISGSVGLMIFRALRQQILLQQMELRGSKSNPRELMLRALSAQFLSGWRLVHYPLAVFFILMTILHIMQSLKFMVH